MTDWNPLHRDAIWLERVSDRAEMNSREVDKLKAQVFFLSSVVFALIMAGSLILCGGLS